MSITNYPKVLKYAIGDRPFRLGRAYAPDYIDGYANNSQQGWSTGYIQRVKVTGWKTVVSNPSGDGNTAVQKDFYIVKDIIGYDNFQIQAENWIELYDVKEYTLPAEKLFSSRNHLLSVIKGKYLNSPFGDLSNNANLYFESLGNRDGSSLNDGDWVDKAGMDFRNAKWAFDGEELLYKGSWSGWIGQPTGYVGGEGGGVKTQVFDNCNFTGATMPNLLNTRAKMRANCYSYDKLTTIYTNGVALDPALD